MATTNVSGAKIKYFRNGTFIDMSFKPHSTKQFNSYHEWRKASHYTKTQNSMFVELISSNNNIFTYEQCIERLNQCLEANIPPTDILIAILYLSCHHFSPHAMKLIKHLLIKYSNTIDLNVTSISSPQFTIPHVAAMNGDFHLLQIYYNLNGNINAKDGRSVFPITISVAERQLKTCETLLWMNGIVNAQQMSMLDERSIDDAASFIAAFLNFIAIIEWSKKYIHQQLKMPHELSEVVTNYILPINAYDGVKDLLRKFMYNRSSDWNEIEKIAKAKLSQNDGEIQSVATIGVDWESGSSCVDKVATDIYVQPTRVEGRVRLLQYGNVDNSHPNSFTLLIFGCVFMASTAIIWRRR